MALPEPERAVPLTPLNDALCPIPHPRLHPRWSSARLSDARCRARLERPADAYPLIWMH